MCLGIYSDLCSYTIRVTALTEHLSNMQGDKYIFRPYEKDGPDSIRCTNETCRMLKPSEANIIWNSGSKLVRGNEDLT